MDNKRLKTQAKRFFAAACIGAAFCISLYMAILWAFPFPHDAIENMEYSKSVFDKDGNLLRAFTGKDDCWLMPVELKELNPAFINATVSVEDKRFWRHHGVDPGAVLRAAGLNASNGRVISGASTISMQVIRLFEGRKRTLPNKIIEAAHAVYLERLYSKEDILKLYFEIAPYGGNIHGVKAASLRYFQKNPEDLSLAECALLAGLPQSPSRLRPDRYPGRAKERRDRVLLSMLKNGYITGSRFREASEEPVVAGNYPFPFRAPHFTRYVKYNSTGSGITTTLDPDMQYFAELAITEAVRDLRPRGVTNGAMVVIENGTGKVRAMVGSCDFFSFEDFGQINGSLSRRSPGSALKPFTYAIAFDRGLYTPGMVLADVPVQYSGYMPLDYDKKYRGPVTVRDALVDSLNIPAVNVLEDISYQSLYLFLKDAGVSTLNKPPGHYGLSLTLGSAGVNLLELTNAYAMLARLGVYKPYSFIETAGIKPDSSGRLLSEGAAYLVSDILSDGQRLEAKGIYRDERTYPRVAWKTGTSYGHRDAWTVCYNPEYTVGVWIGNFSARPSKALVGLEAAAPVAIQIFDRLYANKPAPWYEMPGSVGERRVCALSGEPAGGICPHSVRDLYLKGRSAPEICKVHQKIAIDNETGLALDRRSRKERQYTEKVFAIWPNELQSWFKSRNPDYEAPPEYLKTPKRVVNLDKNRPKIVSPAHGCEYFASGMPESEQILPLAANGSFDTDKLYWFIDGRFYNNCEIGERLFWSMEQGRHRITCADQHGRSSSIVIVVR